MQHAILAPKWISELVRINVSRKDFPRFKDQNSAGKTNKGKRDVKGLIRIEFEPSEIIDEVWIEEEHVGEVHSDDNDGSNENLV